MFYGSLQHAEDTLISQAETMKLGGALLMFWMRLKRLKKMYICVDWLFWQVLSLREPLWPFECRLTACVQVPALLNTKAFRLTNLAHEPSAERPSAWVCLVTQSWSPLGPWESTALSQGAKLFHAFILWVFVFLSCKDDVLETNVSVENPHS